MYSGFNLAYVLEGAKLIIVGTWGGGGGTFSRAGERSVRVSYAWGATEILGGGGANHAPLD